MENTSIINNCPTTESDTILGIGLTILILCFLSYLPQYFKIIQIGNVIGISAISLFIGCISAFCNFYGTFLLDAHFWKCCHQNNLTHRQCFTTLLPIIQLFFIWIFINVFYIIFIIYFNKSKNNLQENRSSKSINISFWIYVLIFPIIFGLTGTFLLVSTNILSQHIILYGNILNIISSGLTIIMWAPQIYITYIEKDFVSLSPITISIQAFGSIVIFSYQVLLSKSDLSIGIPFLVAGFQQFIILIIGFYNMFKRKQLQKKINTQLYEDESILLNPSNVDF